MERKHDNIETTSSDESSGNLKTSGCIISLPSIALLLNIIPYVLFLWGRNFMVLILLSIFPIIGFLVGIIALCFGKKRIGKPGVIISIIAVAWPIVFVATTVLLNSVGALMFDM